MSTLEASLYIFWTIVNKIAILQFHSNAYGEKRGSVYYIYLNFTEIPGISKLLQKLGFQKNTLEFQGLLQIFL